MDHYKKYFCILLTVMAFCCAAAFTGFAQDVQTVTETALEGQLTLEDIQALNDGNEKVFVHNERVTFVDGSCSKEPVKSSDDAANVVLSMIGLLGGDVRTQFIPWRELNDTAGNIYYVFQQMYAGTTVLGGAVKVITDADGNMIGLSSSIVSDLPEVDEADGITAEEAEQIVIKHGEEAGESMHIAEGFTEKIILPFLVDIMDDEADESARFVWVVYTNNPDGMNRGTDLPYLAHYVGMDGTYLYSLATIMPGDNAGSTGFDSEYIFEFMEPVEYTGYVDYSDGSEKELTVTVMRDTRTGMYYLGNIERKIVIADCYEFLYNNGRVRLVSSPDNLEWEQTALISFYNYCRAYDYYKEIGWIGGNGLGLPIMILKDFCDENHTPVNNAAFIGNFFGWSLFASSRANDFAQCLDVIAHEFTHCVTGTVMTYNAYTNDFGAINEGMSDIQGEICEQMYGDTDHPWIIGDNSLTTIRSMSNPHRYNQPEYSWDLYYVPPVQKATAINDNGGVHSNSSLLNNLAYRLVENGGMSLEEARAFWFAVDCAMVPGTDYAQLSEILPWVLKTQRMGKYDTALQAGIDATRMGISEMPDFFDNDRALIVLELPENENFTDNNWAMQIMSLEIHGIANTAMEIFNQLVNEDYSNMPETVAKLFTDAKEAQSEEPAPAKEPEKEMSLKDLLAGILSGIGEAKEPTPTPEPTPEPTLDPETEAALNDLSDWLIEQFVDYFYSAMGAAGMDSHTIRMMGRPGRTIPMLMHMAFQDNSQMPVQMVVAIYINDRWYELPLDDISAMTDPEAAETTEEPEASVMDSELVQDLINRVKENIFSVKSVDDFLDLFTYEIKGGEVNEIPATGLENIVLPEPSEEQIDLEIAPTEETPEKMSRPKQSEE